MLNVFVASYKGYNNGILDGKWINLPCDDIWEEIEQSTVEGAGEFFVSDYETDIYGLDIGEHDNIDELNELAETLEGMDLDIVGAFCGCGYPLDEAIEAVENGDYMFVAGRDMSDVAYNYYEETGLMNDIPEQFQYYIDWDAIGRDMEIVGNWHKVEDGYIQIF